MARLSFGSILLLAISVIPVGALEIELKEVAKGFEWPIHITHAGDGSGRLFIAEHDGTIRLIDKSGTPIEEAFLDLSKEGLDRVSQLKDHSDERGLLGLAFHPDYKNNGRFFVSYTKLKTDESIVAEYNVSGDPNKAETEETIIMGPIDQPQWNHNGGAIEFGPDGYLYIGIGDGGFRGDMGPGHTPDIGNAQDLTNVFGKILRIDVDKKSDGKNYAIPADNPFAKSDGKELPEIYAWGLRNPWKFSFDRKTGQLFCADVGQDKWEEVDIIEKGGNYGWRRMEGTKCFVPEEDCQTGDLLLPIWEYPHDSENGGGLSITGGYVYRGEMFPKMQGRYFVADYASGRFWSLGEDDGEWEPEEHFRVGFYISTFGEDEAGELYTCNYYRGTIFQVTNP